MIKRTFDITARIEQGQIPFCFQCVQGDKDVYALHIRITDGGQEIDYGEISDATITFALANGAVVQSDPERLAISSGGITYEMGTSEISCPGKVLASIQLFGSGGERLTTARFSFEVISDLITPQAVKSTSEFPILQRLAKDVEDTLPLLPEIEETIEKFPQIQGFFNTAQAAENQRISNEITRQSQESVRQAKIIEIEERFQRLTSQQQHDAEVIDARDGEISLRARLDRDHAEFASHLANMANPNLLINGDFQVWQRGTTITGIGMFRYTADRWRLNTSAASGTVTASKVDDGMHVFIGDAPNLVLVYSFEDADWEKLEGNTVTLSYSVDNEIKAQTFTMENNDSNYPKSLAFFVDYGNKTVFTINWVKLELGSSATPFVPRPFAEELAMCQRYFEKSYNYTDAPGTPSLAGDGAIIQTVPAAEHVYLPFRFKVVKRVKPTITLYDEVGAAGKINVGGVNGTDFLSVSSFDGGGVLTTNNIPTTTYLQFYWVADAEIY